MRTSARTNTTNSSHAGFTLIEVLVAMLILAIGVLGIAALQFKGLLYVQDAYYRTQVNYLVYDIADRMRLNNNNAAAYAVNLTNYQVQANPAGACVETGAGAVGMDNDLTCWKFLLSDSLPPGSIADITDNGNNSYTVTLGWTDREGDTHNIAYQFIIRTD